MYHLSQKLSGRVFPFSAKGLGFDALPSISFLYELLSTASAASTICCI